MVLAFWESVLFVRHYVKTWLILDVTLVSLDWVFVVMEASGVARRQRATNNKFAGRRDKNLGGGDPFLEWFVISHVLQVSSGTLRYFIVGSGRGYPFLFYLVCYFPVVVVCWYVGNPWDFGTGAWLVRGLVSWLVYPQSWAQGSRPNHRVVFCLYLEVCNLDVYESLL